MFRQFPGDIVTENFRALGYNKCIQNKTRRKKTMKYVCDVCGWEYDEEQGYPEGGIAPGTRWEDLPEDFECPLCGVTREEFSAE
jgi:rubredoxin-NAD+ reductase